MKTVRKTSRFPASEAEVFKELQELSTLQYIARPFASFKAAEDNSSHVWKENGDYAFEFRLFCLIPMGDPSYSHCTPE